MPAAPDDAPFTDAELDTLFETLGARRDLPGCVIAVSGGSDSLALLQLIRRWRDRRSGTAPPLLVATVDHGLRAGSAAEAEAVARQCAAWGFEHVTLPWTGDKPATGVQAAAREARYGLLVATAHARGFGQIATAHTLDDLAETFMMRLSRGSGLEGLATVLMGGQRDGIVLLRPLREVPRARLRAELTRHGATWVEDPSNDDPRYTRVRWRRLMPLLAAEGLTAERIADVGRKLFQADLAIKAQVHRYMRDHVTVIRAAAPDVWQRYDARIDSPDGASFQPDRRPLRVRLYTADMAFDEPEEVRRRVLSLVIRAVGGQVFAPGAEQFEALLAEIEGAQAECGKRRRTLAGALITVEPGSITVAPEPPRRERTTRRRG